ncbi:MAG: hypothetical protein JWP02_3073 [Acidimicrobiales bacterium]|nr:hypothetical protein [Acidimicrobiales bacterium]
MGVVGGWVVVPLALAALVVGHGLLVERGFRARLPGMILPGVGLAALIIVAGALTLSGTTAPLATPSTLLLAAIGFLWAPPWRRWPQRVAVPVIAAAVAVFVVFALPSVLSGQASVAGYLKLDDAPTWLAMTDRVLHHGRGLHGLAPSSYRSTLETWLGSGYPVGSFLPLGIASSVARQDPAAAFQSAIAVYAVIISLGLAACARALVGTRRRALAVGFIAVQASLFFGYTQWGGIKEAASVALLAPLGFLAVRCWRDDGTGSMAMLAICAGALMGVLGVNGAAWAAPALAVGTIGTAVRWSRTRPGVAGAARRSVAWAALLAACTLPALATISFARQTTENGGVSNQHELGNLAHPLPLLQAAGLWPVPDFRFSGPAATVVVWLAMVCLLSAAAAVVVAIRRRRWTMPITAGVVFVGAVPAILIGSPWVDAKALAIVAPVVLALAVVFGLTTWASSEATSRVAGAALVVVLLGGALWSTATVTRNAYVAPRARFDELRALGHRLAGQGPTLFLDYEVYADRYFLREDQTDGVTDLPYRRVARRDGTPTPTGGTAEVDDIAVSDLWVYRTIVRRRSPAASRPPEGYELVYAGRAWEAWQRGRPTLPPLARLPLGRGDDPTDVPTCEAVERLAATPGTEQLVGARRASPVLLQIAARDVPRSWRNRAGIAASGDARISLTVPVEKPGRHRVWLKGAVLGTLDIRVDGRSVGKAKHELAHAGQWLRFGEVVLAQGTHRVELRYTRGVRSGVGFPPPLVGPVTVSPVAGPVLTSVPASDFRQLCDGSRYDWIDATR